MLQPRRGADFGEEALTAQYCAQVGMPLDRHIALVFDVVREIHRGHAAGAEFPLDAVAVGEGTRKAGQGVAYAVAITSHVVKTRPLGGAWRIARDGTVDRLRERIFDTQFREQRKVAIAGEERVNAVRDADGGNARVMHHGSAHTRATHELRQYAGEPLRLAE